MSNVNKIQNCSLITIFAEFKSNKIDLLVTKEQIKGKSQLILVLVAVLSNEGSGEPVHMCR